MRCIADALYENSFNNEHNGKPSDGKTKKEFSLEEIK